MATKLNAWAGIEVEHMRDQKIDINPNFEYLSPCNSQLKLLLRTKQGDSMKEIIMALEDGSNSAGSHEDGSDAEGTMERQIGSPHRPSQANYNDVENEDMSNNGDIVDHGMMMYESPAADHEGSIFISDLESINSPEFEGGGGGGGATFIFKVGNKQFQGLQALQDPSRVLGVIIFKETETI